MFEIFWSIFPICSEYGANVQYMHIYLNIFPNISVHCSLHNFPWNTIRRMWGFFFFKESQHTLSILGKFIKVGNYAALNIALTQRLLSATAEGKETEARSISLHLESQHRQTWTHLRHPIFLSQMSKSDSGTRVSHNTHICNLARTTPRLQGMCSTSPCHIFQACCLFFLFLQVKVT